MKGMEGTGRKEEIERTEADRGRKEGREGNGERERRRRVKKKRLGKEEEKGEMKEEEGKESPHCNSLKTCLKWNSKLDTTFLMYFNYLVYVNVDSGNKW